MSDVVEIESFLRAEGFGSVALQQARTVLEARGLTRAGKRGMAAEKLDAARAALADGIVRHCGDAECERLARTRCDGRVPVPVTAVRCEVCGGSNNRRAALMLADRLRQEGVSRLLIVGGTPTLHHELEQLLAPHGIRLRCVDGATGSHSARDAAPDLQWAQVVVIWGASPLPHKVSNLYTQPPPGVRVVKFARRGIEALCREVLRSFD